MPLNSLCILIIINQIYHYHSSNIISLPINSFFKYSHKANITSIDDLAETYLYSKINIGEPSYEIKAFLSIYHSYFSLTKNLITKKVNDSLSYYDMEKSNSFKNVSNNLDDNNYNSIAQETFILKFFGCQKLQYFS